MGVKKEQAETNLCTRTVRAASRGLSRELMCLGSNDPKPEILERPSPFPTKGDWLENLHMHHRCGGKLGMLTALQAIGVAGTLGSTTSIALAPRWVPIASDLRLSIKTVLIAMPDAAKFVFLSPSPLPLVRVRYCEHLPQTMVPI